MTENELKLIEMIRKCDDHASAVLVAIDIIANFVSMEGAMLCRSLLT